MFFYMQIFLLEFKKCLALILNYKEHIYGINTGAFEEKNLNNSKKQ